MQESRGCLCDDLSPTWDPHLSIDFLCTADDNDRRGRSDVVARSDLPADFAEQIDSDDGRLAFQVFFDPIHDGFGREAGHSCIAEELHDHSSSTGKRIV